MTQTIVQILLLIVSGVAVFTVIVPRFDEIGTIQEETRQYDEALQSAFATNERLAALTAQVDNLSQQERFRLDRIAPEVIDPLRLAFDLETLVERAGLFLIGLDVASEVVIEDPVQTSAQTEVDDFEAPAALKKMATQEYTITVAGTYEQFKSLLAEVENSAQLLEVSLISFEDTNSDLSQFTLVVEAYGLQPRNPEGL